MIRTLQEHLGSAGLRHAFILGTGLGPVARKGAGDLVIPYAEIAGFPQAHVSGHAGELVLRRHGDRFDAFLLGRAHFYESGNARAMKGAIDALAACGAQSLVITCASGSTRPQIAPGEIVRVSDHINFSGTNPLIGETGDTRFVPMTQAYDAALGARLEQAAAQAQVNLHRGIYMWFFGPSFETPAEVRMAALLGADLVGMSLVPEVILARHAGLKVAGLSLVTNFAAGIAGGAPNHAETKRVAAAGAERMGRIIDAFLAQES